MVPADQEVGRGIEGEEPNSSACSAFVEEVEGVCGTVLIERDERIALICLARLDDHMDRPRRRNNPDLILQRKNRPMDMPSTFAVLVERRKSGYREDAVD